MFVIELDEGIFGLFLLVGYLVSLFVFSLNDFFELILFELSLYFIDETGL